MLHSHHYSIKTNEECDCVLKVSMIDQVEEIPLAVLRLVNLDP